MNYSVFFSWQSDLPNNTNRTAIKGCIEKAIKELSLSDEIGASFIYDESTWGETGAPEIAQTIILKIEKSDIFICDISIINKNTKFRKSPNPNVLFELGFAISALGWDKVICIFNNSSGKIEQLPFDINHKRVLAYSPKTTDYKVRLTHFIKEAIEAMISKGVLYNPLKDRLKGMIDYCILASLKQVCCLLYGTITMSDAFGKVQELLSSSLNELNEKLLDGHKILGFFAENNLQDVRSKLDGIFLEVTSSSIYPTKWALTILSLIDWIRSYQWLISERSGTAFATKAQLSNQVFGVIKGSELNPDNPPNSYVLIKNIGGKKGEVLYSATMPRINTHILLTFQNIIKENTAKYSEWFYRLVSIANNWLSTTGAAFVLDPDYYEIT